MFDNNNAYKQPRSERAVLSLTSRLLLYDRVGRAQRQTTSGNAGTAGRWVEERGGVGVAQWGGAIEGLYGCSACTEVGVEKWCGGQKGGVGDEGWVVGGAKGFQDEVRVERWVYRAVFVFRSKVGADGWCGWCRGVGWWCTGVE